MSQTMTLMSALAPVRLAVQVDCPEGMAPSVFASWCESELGPVLHALTEDAGKAANAVYSMLRASKNPAAEHMVALVLAEASGLAARSVLYLKTMAGGRVN